MMHTITYHYERPMFLVSIIGQLCFLFHTDEGCHFWIFGEYECSYI